MSAPLPELLNTVELKYLRAIRVNASSYETQPADGDADDWPDRDGLAARATIFAGTGDLGIGWRVRLRRAEMIVSAWVIATYDAPADFDFSAEQFREDLDTFVQGRGQRDLRPYFMGVATAMEGFLTRPEFGSAEGHEVKIEGLINLDTELT